MKEYLPYILSSILGSGFLSAIYMLLKLRPEAGQITVTAAQGAVIVQTGVIENLRIEMERLREELAEVRIVLQKTTQENDSLRVRIRILENK